MPFQGGIQTGSRQERAVLKCYKVYDDIGSRDSPAVLVFWNFIYNLVSDICVYFGNNDYYEYNCIIILLPNLSSIKVRENIIQHIMSI